jgi:hypothetical protein
MGMDVRGKNDKYFRANCWHWRPLWDYCYQVAPHIIDEKTYNACQFNDGKGLDAIKADKLGMFLINLLASGEVEKYKADRDKKLATLPPRLCLACNGSGTIASLVQHDNMYDTKTNPCKTCNGLGLRDNWEKSYPFKVEVVDEWAEFLIECGGFEVW